MSASSLLRSAARWLLLALAAVSSGALAHEVRPAYLQITETAPNRYDVVWRTPLLSGMRLPVALKLPAEARTLVGPNERDFDNSIVAREIIDVKGGLAGKRVEFVGLQATITDVLVRVQMLDGEKSTTLVRPSQPWLKIGQSEGPVSVFVAYVQHGIEHILLGYDHLLFVAALMLIVRKTRVLLWTITAFTLAHSITLALATLGVVHVPVPPVEAAIALSIVLLAVEVIRMERGGTSLAIRWPWIISFSFGLLHGFGFASALTGIGLPQGDIPLALFSFNVGVEIGQLIFIGVLLTLVTLVRKLFTLPKYAPIAAAYVVGVPAAFWMAQRLASVFL